jgi:hypothetical protein
MAIGEVFLRPPNHLNPMMTDVAKFVAYKDLVRAEDLDWTIRMARTGFLTHEYKTDDERIHYIYNLGDRPIDSRDLMRQGHMSYEKMLSTIVTTNAHEIPEPRQSQQQGLRLTPRGFVSK